MIDDLSNTATTLDGEVRPWNDWGYGKDSEHSLYSYLKRTLLAQFPEIKGTFFYPIASHAVQNPSSNWRILQEPVDAEFIGFISEISDRFDLAFHGTSHGRYIDFDNPEIAGNFEQEFSYLTESDIPRIKKQIDTAEESLGVVFTGGKCPGIVKNEFTDGIIRALGFKWWTLNEVVVNRKHDKNRHTYMDADGPLLLPMNLIGNCLSRCVKDGGGSRQFIRGLRRNVAHFRIERFIGYLYDRGYPITIQEHFQNQRTDGKRQLPNLFDDLPSVEQLYGILRGADIWHATSSDIAHSLESCDRSEVIRQDDNAFTVEYDGSWERPFLSLKCDTPVLTEVESGIAHKGIYKQGMWIFNNVAEGMYRVGGIEYRGSRLADRVTRHKSGGKA